MSSPPSAGEGGGKGLDLDAADAAFRKLPAAYCDHAGFVRDYAAPLLAEVRRLRARPVGSLDALREAAQAMLDSYVSLVNAGDAGNWDPEEEPEVIALRAALLERSSVSPKGEPDQP